MAFVYPLGLTVDDFADLLTGSGWQPWNFLYGAHFVIGSSGTATQMSINALSENGTLRSFKYGLYTSAGALVVQSTGSTSSTSLGWVDSGTFSQALSAGTYYVLVSSDGNETNFPRYGYSTQGNGSFATEAYATAMQATETITDQGDTGQLYGVRLDFTAEVAGNLEANPGAGALTAAGPAPTKLVNWARAPGVGAVTAAGNAPSFIERSTRYAYPSADLDAGPWTPSTGAVLYAMIDEAVADDNDYIVTNTSGTAKITLKPVADPGSSSGHVVNYRIWSPVGGNATVRLVQGASTVIASWDHTGLPTTATNYSQPLSGAEADSITDYDDLHIEFEAT